MNDFIEATFAAEKTNRPIITVMQKRIKDLHNFSCGANQIFREDKLARGLNRVVKEFNEISFEAYKQGYKECQTNVGYTLDTLKANLENKNLTDEEFRFFVGTIIEQLEDITSE